MSRRKIHNGLSQFGARSRLLMLLLLTGGLLIADSLIFVEERHQERLDQTKSALGLAAMRAADRQSDAVAAARQLLTVVTKIAPHVDVCSDDFLKINIRGNEWLRRISLVSAQGDVLCTTGGFSGVINIADQVHFRAAVETRDFALGNYMISLVSRDPVLIAAAPRLALDGTVAAVITAVIDLAYLNRVAASFDPDRDAKVLLIDATGTIAVASPNAREQIGQNVRDRQYFRALAEKPDAIADVEDSDGERRFYAGVRLQDGGSQIVIGFPQREIAAQYRQGAIIEIGVKTLIVIALLALFWAGADTLILKPIRQLTKAARDFGRGDHAVRVDAGSMTREFAELADTFNDLVEQVTRKEAVIVDHSRTLENANARLATLATQDELTGLANRRALTARLEEVFSAGENAGAHALFVIDLDKFKPVNDVFGHAAGDTILREAATRLQSLCRPHDLVARLGGDEFAILLSTSPTAEADAEGIAERIVDALAADFVTPQGVIRTGGTTGVAIAGRHGTTPDDLLRAADVAMYRAKQERSGYRFFVREMQDELQDRMSIEKELREAIPRGDIVPFYQPIVDLSDGRIVGVEMLARWLHAERGMVPPDRFVPIVAEIGLSDAMTRQILLRACEDARDWPEHISLALNLSPNQLCDATLPALLSALIESRGQKRGRFEIEVTEDALARDFAKARDVIEQFRRVGMRVALDDFGTGYSSLQHLHELKFDKLKIDRAFIRDLRLNDDVRKLVSTILALARGMHLVVVAEGIEAEAEADDLAAMGCALGQGYAFGRPMPACEIEKLLTSPPQRQALRA